MSLTYILGKDAALEDSINLMQHKLSLLGFNIEQVSWLNPVVNVWSVHIRDRDCHYCFTNGKGASKAAALASALGEFFERLACNYFFADYYLGEQIANAKFVHYPQEIWLTLDEINSGTKPLLDPALSQWFDPELELDFSDLVDLNSGNSSRGICCLPFTRQADGQQVHIPLNIIANLYVSNGMAAGNSKSEARVQALSEILERFVKNRIISEGLALPQIPAEVLAGYPEIESAINAIESSGFKVIVFDASLGGLYPVISVALLDPVNAGCYAAFGAHPKFEVALERTVTELLQGRELGGLHSFPEPSLDLLQVADQQNLETHFIDSSGTLSWMMFKQNSDFEFCAWDFQGDTVAEFTYLIDCVQSIAQDIYIADYSHLGVYACRILVPSVSEIYPVDDLKWQNSNSGNQLRQQILELSSDSLQIEQLLQVIDSLDLDESLIVMEFIGVISDKDSPWFNLRFGELQALLALAIADFELAYNCVCWTLDFCALSLTAHNLSFYRALKVILELEQDPDNKLADYLPAFKALYSTAAVDKALAHISGELKFSDLTPIDSQLSGLVEHQQLLQAYNKVQQAKQSQFVDLYNKG